MATGSKSVTDDKSANRIATTLSPAGRASGSLLGLAVGDAMGWPQEDRSGRIDSVSPSPVSPRFSRWTRKTGGRFFYHEEKVRPGDYSDDTQLALASARSIFYEDWWHHFSRFELPFFLDYERGAGTATKRSARSWRKGRPPWEDDLESYVQAGGNGVAMRIAPHVLQSSSSATFEDAGLAILRNGITTHGHPRALLGALAYGYALWRLAKRDDVLQYGGLIEGLLKETDRWSTLPDLSNVAPNWEKSVLENPDLSYRGMWDRTTQEIVDGLEVSRRAISRGALSVDRAMLRQIKAIDSKYKGAGSITAVASVFLASRYAADPLQGLTRAAFLSDADTDTLAAMTGALLGCLSGVDWLGQLSSKVQDAAYIRRLGERLVLADDDKNSSLSNPPSSTDLRSFLERLKSLDEGESVTLPDGRKATIEELAQLPARSERVRVYRWLVKCDDGQTLFLKKIERLDPSETQRTEDSDSAEPSLFSEVEQESLESSVVRLTESHAKEAAHAGVRILVRRLEQVADFYSEVLEIPITNRTKRQVTFADTLTFRRAAPGELSPQTGSFEHRKEFHVYVRVGSVSAAMRRVVESGLPVVGEIQERHNRFFFRCFDPEGNFVEVFSPEK